MMAAGIRIRQIYFWGGLDHTTSPLKWQGLFVDFGFDNISNNATRTLNYIEIGTMSASGMVRGTINTINGMALSRHRPECGRYAQANGVRHQNDSFQ